MLAPAGWRGTTKKPGAPLLDPPVWAHILVWRHQRTPARGTPWRGSCWDPTPQRAGQQEGRHLLDQVEDEPLQGVVVGFWQVLQDGVDGGQLLLLLWQL